MPLQTLIRTFFGLVCAFLALGGNAFAQEADATANSPQAGLAGVDWVIIAVYALSTIGLGWYYSRKQSSTKEYFVGTGHMNPILIGVSLFATLLSTISYLSMPGEVLGKGPVNLCALLSVPLVYWFVGYVLLPIYMKQRVTSAYELLEEKLGPNIRTLGAVLFVILRLVWMSLLIYLTAEAMAAMIGVGKEKIPLIALITGFVAVVYTSLGGLRAVVITDLIQTILLFGGAVLVIVTVTFDLGGLSWIPTKWNPNWDVQPIFSTDLTTRVTLVGAMVTNFVWYICTLGGDQTSVQRFMATVDLRAARRALATQLTVAVIVALTLALVGFALLGYFQAHPNGLGEGLTLANDADQAFPMYIAYHLPPGISGLVVAAMFAAAMSSIDSGVNSITAVVFTDLSSSRRSVHDTSESNDSSGDHVAKTRWMAFGIGAIVVLGSTRIGAIPGNITEVTTKTANLLATPIFGLFFFALFVPFASPKGVIIGTICGTTTAILVAFGDSIFGTTPISFQWIGAISLTATIATGCVGSLLFPVRNKA